MVPTITRKVKSSEKGFCKTVLSPKLWFCYFVQKTYALLASPFNLLQKQSLWTGKRIQWFSIYYFLFKYEKNKTNKQKKKKKKKKKTHTQIKIYAFFKSFQYRAFRGSVVSWFRGSSNSRYLVCATPPLQFYVDLSETLKGVFVMVWRCACGLDMIIRFIFVTFYYQSV